MDCCNRCRQTGNEASCDLEQAISEGYRSCSEYDRARQRLNKPVYCQWRGMGGETEEHQDTQENAEYREEGTEYHGTEETEEYQGIQQPRHADFTFDAGTNTAFPEEQNPEAEPPAPARRKSTRRPNNQNRGATNAQSAQNRLNAMLRIHRTNRQNTLVDKLDKLVDKLDKLVDTLATQHSKSPVERLRKRVRTSAPQESNAGFQNPTFAHLQAQIQQNAFMQMQMQMQWQAQAQAQAQAQMQQNMAYQNMMAFQNPQVQYWSPMLQSPAPMGFPNMLVNNMNFQPNYMGFQNGMGYQSTMNAQNGPTAMNGIGVGNQNNMNAQNGPNAMNDMGYQNSMNAQSGPDNSEDDTVASHAESDDDDDS